MRVLDDLGQRDNTLIVFAGDNGLAVGQHGLMGKQNLYDHSVRVPLVFAGPGIPPGITSDALVYLLDVFPTLCDVLELPVPRSVEGRSLIPHVNGPEAPLRDALYLAYGWSLRGVTDGRHKLIEYACGETQLFDLEGDPHEMHNLAGVADSAGTLQHLRRRLLSLARELDDANHPTGAKYWSMRADLKNS